MNRAADTEAIQMRLEELTLAEWEAALPESGFEVFHAPEALGALSEHTEAELRLYGAFKGQEPIGLVPVFVESKGVGRLITSPPPSMIVPRLGPLVMPTSPKQRKRESVTREFVDLLLDAVDAESARSLVRFQCPLSYEDPRPFQWADLTVSQSFTYVLDLDGRTPEAVFEGFSSSLRRDIRDCRDGDVSVAVEGVDGAERVHEHVANRYVEQGESPPVGREYVRDVVEAMDDRCRVYVARDSGGEYLSGIVVLYSNDAASFWLGGARADHDGGNVNSYLHWTVVEDAIESEGIDASGYDLVGANTPRLCRYKSKFGAELVPYYTVESSGVQMSVAKQAYALLDR